MPIFDTLNLGWNRFGGKMVCLGEQERGDEVPWQNYGRPEKSYKKFKYSVLLDN